MILHHFVAYMDSLRITYFISSLIKKCDNQTYLKSVLSLFYCFYWTTPPYNWRGANLRPLLTCLKIFETLIKFQLKLHLSNTATHLLSSSVITYNPVYVSIIFVNAFFYAYPYESFSFSYLMSNTFSVWAIQAK